ncbi:hypothetical protein ALP85_200125 [Pseudomonas syringae pv. syringae]|nr:hypothetical protein ALP85_200125 [Pseudomonas syringae pv. syringae]
MYINELRILLLRDNVVNVVCYLRSSCAITWSSGGIAGVCQGYRRLSIPSSQSRTAAFGHHRLISICLTFIAFNAGCECFRNFRSLNDCRIAVDEGNHPLAIIKEILLLC